ncbi:hypothetical protein PR202_gb14819 [Eleusine coracana subsp. coracana]|uniref:Uncharacterized protein n=1 Tax=Eleusine coracana subsp. coracana TaxID=191504 RepID=A0AAV5EWS5_ELECO|nr:hypothetical protein PR202_gb14819 [Eleusine coracana subsp. coracana]
MFHAHHANAGAPRRRAGARARPASRATGGHLVPEQAARLGPSSSSTYAALKKTNALHAAPSRSAGELALAAQLHEMSERLREREDRGGRIGGAGEAATASSSSCNGGGEEEVEDDKRNVLVDMEPPESCVLGGPCTTPADVSVDSECDDHAVDYHDGFPDSFCAATPELWEPWPLLEWNAVA